MKKDIPHNKFTSYLINSRLCLLTHIGAQNHTYIYIPTGKTLTIPVQVSYSKEFLENLITDSAAIDIPFHLFWLYIAVL